MKKIISLFFSTVILSSILCASAFSKPDSLLSTLKQIAVSADCNIGIAVINIERNETLTINGKKHFPMQSVYKFPLAIYVLHLVDKGKLSLEKKIHITKKDLPTDTWSPLRDKYPEGNIDVTVAELLGYSVSNSDNITTDILFNLVGGTLKVEKFIKTLGFKAIAIRKTEAEMHEHEKNQFKNWAEPIDMANLLKGFYERKYLLQESNDLLYKMMAEATSGPRRLKGLLPEGAIVAHKTGTSSTSDVGVAAATNDIGIITLPGGAHLVIVVFVSMSKQNYETRENVIARVAKAAWDHYSSQK